MREVRLDPRARFDLKMILLFFQEEGSLGVGANLVRNFRQTCRLLSDFPHLGRKLDAKRVVSEQELDLYQFPIERFPRYLIIYRVGPHALSVTRILHSARNPALRSVDPS